MKCSDIIYQPKEVKSFHIVGRSDLSSVEPYLTSLLSTYKHLYAFIDKELMMKSQIVRDLAVALQEMKCPMRTVEATEQAKTMDTVLQMCSWLMDKGADRDAVLVAVGGGITTDLVGFTAGIYKRGVRYVNIPSTLLSQVDAAIGGKTGVNFEKYKNMLGVIQQPAFTFIWPELLHTLPKRDFLSGAAEMLKTFIIEDNGNYQKAVQAKLVSTQIITGDFSHSLLFFQCHPIASFLFRISVLKCRIFKDFQKFCRISSISIDKSSEIRYNVGSTHIISENRSIVKWYFVFS